MSTTADSKSDVENKVVEQSNSYTPSVSNGEVTTSWKDTLAHLKHTFTTKEGWIGDYVYNSPPSLFSHF
jgi:hypothetical protein